MDSIQNFYFYSNKNSLFDYLGRRMIAVTSVLPERTGIRTISTKYNNSFFITHKRLTKECRERGIGLHEGVYPVTLQLSFTTQMAENYPAVLIKRNDDGISIQLASLKDYDTPDWVHINYASAQIHTNNIFRIALNPTMFIRRLQRADGADPSVLNQRTAVYREFLALCNSIYENDNTVQIDLAGITRGAQYFGLSDCIELKRLTALVRNEKLPDPESEEGTSKVNDDANHAQVEALLKELAVKAEILDDMEEEKKELSLRVEELVAQNAQLASSKGDLEFLRQQNEQAKLELQKKDEAIDRLTKRVDDLLSQLNRLLPQSSGTSQRKKLLVIGASQVSADRLSGIAKHYGFDKRNIEFWLDYDKLTSKLASLQYNSAYSGIIVGPTPHKAAGNDGYSSPLARLKQEGYPYTVEARSKSGELKITVDTFRSALEQMDAYLKSGGII